MSYFLSPASAYISTGNSSTTNLAVGNSYTFTGTAEQTNHPDVMVTLFADQVTAISLQFSHDGTNWDSTISKIGAPSLNEFTTSVKGKRYFRVVVTTASLTTTVFRLQTQFGLFRQGNLSLNTVAGLDSDALVVRPSDFNLEVARSLRASTIAVNKFGRAPSGVQTTATDIWSRADATPTQQIWIAPTQARVHAIVSTAVTDVAGSTGATSVTVYGLTSWTTAETSETVTLNGTTPVNTANSYVIIHRLVANASATTTAPGVNLGTISATAATDGTVTAIISIAQGQTQMAIYGVPSIQTFYLKRFFASINDSTAASRVDVELRVNSNPDTQRLAFRNVRDVQLSNQGSSALSINLDIPVKVAGPCIIKVQGIASSADLDCSAGFDGYLVTN
tara:strand:- start:1236 stop:2411 length:1176 start_codon:yes stop_codon:yes gene_type:complete